MRRLLIGLLLLLGCVSPLHADIELSAYLGSLTEVTSTATTDYLAILRGTTLYKIKPENITGAGITATLGADISIIMGDTGGANKIKFLDSDSVEMGSINSDGAPTFGTGTGVVYATSGAYSPVSSISGASVEVDTASRIVCSDANKKIIACSAATGTGIPVLATDPQISQIQLGHASDTTVARASAGVLSVEGVTITRTIASGTSALGTSEIAAGDHATVVTTTATGTLTTDVISWNFNADPHGVTGYAPSTNGGLFIYAYPTAGNVNFLVVNNTAAAITPGAITLNWKVLR